MYSPRDSSLNKALKLSDKPLPCVGPNIHGRRHQAREPRFLDTDSYMVENQRRFRGWYCPSCNLMLRKRVG